MTRDSELEGVITPLSVTLSHTDQGLDDMGPDFHSNPLSSSLSQCGVLGSPRKLVMKQIPELHSSETLIQ
jgi:hypothetical protein